ncbi:MAG: divalent-cation tolerance protein CutA [Thaumarchaeota archaeon]|nr:divalent-cation tolerance protein CutA [Nitrososphaerota archaeon]
MILAQLSMFSIVLVSSPSGEGKKLARYCVERRLAACANIISNGDSIYWWKGEIEEANEDIVLFKTKTSMVKDLIASVKEIHSYETPEIIALRIDDADKDYVAWIEKETSIRP